MVRNKKNKKWFVVLGAVIVCLASGSVQAGTVWLEREKLFAAAGAAYDQFGASVSVSGDLAIVGADMGDGSVADSGSAYIFQWDGTSWVQQQKLLASDGWAGDGFGRSVSISGDLAIVGAWGDDDNGGSSGSAYIFEWDGTSWVEQQKLFASDGVAGDMFGLSVSISGDLAIVGAEGDDDNGTWSGSAYVFRWDGTSWVQQQKLLASDGAIADEFGWSVSITSALADPESGDYAIVGTYYDDDSGESSGSAYIFKWDGTSWFEQQKLLASDGDIGDHFGHSVSISGDQAIVGARGDDDNGGRHSGSAYVFKRAGTSWVEQQKLFASDGAAGDWFGVSASISGDYCVVGAWNNGAKQGSAYIFKWDKTNWVEEQKLLASDGAVGDCFGSSVSVSGAYAVVGALFGAGNEVNSGSAYMFELVACPSADLNGDCCVDFLDYTGFANQWPLTNCSSPDWCGGADLDENGKVNWFDLDIFCDQWLQCAE